jgi:hypothetical protein
VKYIGEIIEESRRDTRNEDIPTSNEQVGISTEDFLRYANFAQEKCFSVIIAAKSTRFEVPKVIDLVVDQMEYDIEDNVYLGESVKNVEYSNSGLDRDYHEIREVSLSRRSDESGHVTNYIRHAGGLIFTPKNNVSGAKVRVVYDRMVDTLDLRRGTVTDRTISSTALTTLTLDTTTHDADALERAQYLCVNDAYGNVTMYNIPITSYDSATGVVTLDSFTFDTGETCAVGSYVTVGEYTTTHSKLNKICEKYIAQYMEYKIFRRDSSEDQKAAKEDMRESIGEIAQAYADNPRDECDIQIDNEALMLGED